MVSLSRAKKYVMEYRGERSHVTQYSVIVTSEPCSERLVKLTGQGVFDQLGRFLDTVERDETTKAWALTLAEEHFVQGLEPSP